jgi:hypothetical protein
MSTPTIREKLIDGLKHEGFEVIQHRTTKYTVLSLGGEPDLPCWFVGKSGALRRSSSGNVTASVDKPQVKARLLREWDERNGVAPKVKTVDPNEGRFK